MGEKWIICRWKNLFSFSMADWSFYFAGLCFFLKLFYAYVLRGIVLFLDIGENCIKIDMAYFCFSLFFLCLLLSLKNNSVFVLYEVTFSTVFAIVFGATRFPRLLTILWMCVFCVFYRHGVPSLYGGGFLGLREDWLPQRCQWKHHCHGAP